MNNYEWLELIPTGWVKLVRDMINECEAINSSYRIQDIKEKWGVLRISSSINCNIENWPVFCDNKIEAIEEKYIEKSARTCCICGKPATKISTGWICPFCDDCGIKPERYYRRFNNDSTTTNNN